MRTIKNSNLNGRPPKSATELHKYKITVRFATKEYYSLRAKSKSAGMNVSDYIRFAVVSSVVHERITPSHLKSILQMVGMANNLNQIARRANSCEYSDIRGEYLHLAADIDNIIRSIRNDG